MSRTTIIVVCIVLLVVIGIALAGLRFRGTARDGKASAMAGLRLMMLKVEPSQLSAPIPSTEHGVWGSVTDVSVGRDTATVVFLADGTSSLYVSTGGGILGGESHEPVRRAGMGLLACLERSFTNFHRGSPGPPPNPGNVRFYVHARDGLFVSDDVNPDELVSGQHALSACFVEMNRVLLALKQSVQAPGG